MGTTTFLNPEFFWLFLLLPIAGVWYYYKQNQDKPILKISSLQGFANTPNTWSKLRYLLFTIRLLALSCIIIALARPRSIAITNKTNSTNGIDIVIASDVSGSMLAKDLKPNRLEALKKVASSFVTARINDRIGIVVYAGEAYTKTPVTNDKAMVLQAIKTIQYQNILQEGTSIGMGLATAVNRLKDSKAKSKVIILMTDGVNNAGFLEPITAAEIAAQYAIKVYTIGIGTNGNAMFPYAYAPNGGFLFKMMPVQIDQELMKQIAQKTGGKYFRAQDNSGLEKIYTEINALEKTKIDELRFMNYDEKFRPFILISLLLLLIEIILRNTIFKSFI